MLNSLFSCCPRIRSLCARVGLIGIAAIAALPQSTLAAGALVQGDGSFVDGPTSSADIASVRALLFRQRESVTAVVQAAVASNETIGTAWILPVPGELLEEPAAASPALLDELLRVSDPLFQRAGNCGDSCAYTMGDSGDLADVRFFDLTSSSATWSHFPGTAIEGALDSLQSSGFDLSTGMVENLRSFALEGGSFVVVRFTGTRPGGASPAIVVRYASTELLLPQAITAHSAQDEVQTAVLTITEGPTSPEGMAQTTPTLGLPLYGSHRASEFYQARVRVALEAAGGDAWVLEYSNTLASLQERSLKLVDSSILWDPDSDLPWEGLQALVSRGYLDEFDSETIWITRWRTFQKPTQLRNQRFIDDANVPIYEVFVPGTQFGASAWLLGAPLLLGGWALRRRRREG